MKIILINKIISNKKGFGAVELLVTIVIVAIALVGIMGLVAKIVEATKRSKVQIVSLNLAREAVEVIRNKRDSNWLAGNQHYNGLENGTDYTATLNFNPVTNEWTLNFTPNSIDDTASKLYFDETQKIYSHDTNDTPADFSRIVSLDLICRDNATGTETIRTSGSVCGAGTTRVGTQITATVKHTASSFRNTVIVDKIYNWR